MPGSSGASSASVAGGSSNNTPQKRRKADSGGDSMVQGALDSEIAFITEALYQKLALLMSVASFLRSGTLEKAMNDFGKDKDSKTGRIHQLLAPSAKKCRDIRYKHAVEVVKGFSQHMETQATNIEMKNDMDSAEKSSIIIALMHFGANTEDKTDLPTEYEGFRNMATLVSMFRCRYEQVGSRLEQYDSSRPRDFGYFKKATGEGTEIDDYIEIITNKKFKIGIPTTSLEQSPQAASTVIDNHHPMKAKVKVKSSTSNLHDALVDEHGEDAALLVVGEPWGLPSDRFPKMDDTSITSASGVASGASSAPSSGSATRGRVTPPTSRVT